MKKLLLAILIFSLSLFSCSRTFVGLIRNNTNTPATVDVYLVRKSKMHSLPNQVRFGKYIDNIKKKDLDSISAIDTVNWLAENHFRYTIRPSSIVLLKDFEISLANGQVFSNVMAVITSENSSDTIKEGWRILEQFKNVNGLLCYDIKN